MKKKQSYNFGFRGWMLMIYQFIAFFTFTVFTNFPMNILAEDFYGGATLVANVYTYATIAGIIIQLIASKFIGKIKNMKNISLILGAVSLVVGVFLMVYPAPMGVSVLWLVMFAIETLATELYATFTIGVLAGQWFPRRKGTFMGIATIAFPVTNALIGIFASSVFEMDLEAGAPKLILWLTSGGMAGSNTIFTAFLPFFIVALIGWLIGLIFVKDYPEQCGAYRDNDKSITPEVAKAMMEQEIEAKKTTVWTTGRTLTTKELWLAAIPMGFLLMFSVGVMTQTSTIIGQYEDLNYSLIMVLLCVFGVLGSYLLGVIDTKFGTKKAILISVILMIISGVIGLFNNSTCLLISLIVLSLFEGASSNFTVSIAAQYWRREDFSSVFAIVNPITNILQAAGPTVVAILLFQFGMASGKGSMFVFLAIAIAGVISTILILLFSAKHVKEKDDKFRAQAGKVLDDALVGRK